MSKKNEEENSPVNIVAKGEEHWRRERTRKSEFFYANVDAAVNCAVYSEQHILIRFETEEQSDGIRNEIIGKLTTSRKSRKISKIEAELMCR